MTHTIYNTRAIVLSKTDTGEADNTLWLLTEDLGLVVANAQGARKEEAKMRSHLQVLGVLSISMVRGKYVWRVVGVESIGRQDTFRTRVASATFAKLSNFVKRMTMPNTDVDLFNLLFKVRQELLRCDNKEQVELIEIMAMARLLTSLGYMPEYKLSEAKISKRQLITDINKAISDSHL